MLKIQPILANTTSELGESPLVVATISSNAVVILHIFLGHDASLDTRGDRGLAVLLSAAENGVKPAAWDYLMQVKEGLHEKIDSMNASSDPAEVEGLKASLSKGHWDLADHLLAQFDAGERVEYALQRLDDNISSCDEHLMVGFFRLPSVANPKSSCLLYDVSSAFDEAKYDPDKDGDRCRRCAKMAVSMNLLLLVEEMERFTFSTTSSLPAAFVSQVRYGMASPGDSNKRTHGNILQRKIGLPSHMGDRIAQYVYACRAGDDIQDVWRRNQTYPAFEMWPTDEDEDFEMWNDFAGSY
ncbi:hypothetical protein AC1031_013474 [Aphanomyces cochlioides]|nr:hypothetical protein AC1031_013474 [Aphanomyces cochlioides]